MSEEKESSGTSDKASAHSAELAALEAQIASARTQLTRIQELVTAANAAKSTAESAQGQVTETLKKATEQLAATEEAAKASIQLKEKIVSDQAVIAEKSQHIESAKAHADKVQKQLTKALENAEGQAAAAASAKEQADAAVNAAKQSQEASKAAKDQADANSVSVKAALDAAIKDAQKTKTLAEVAESIDARVAAYQKSLDALEKQSKERLEEIKRLLPGATSAGLASAFDSRGKIFTSPANRWQWIFVGAVVVLVVIAAHGLWQVHDLGNELTYGTLVRLWLSRLPIAGSLVWLALYASREAALAKRLEEDYAYKAAVATSFQGFQQQMKEVQADAGPDTPLGKLCADTLATMASPPGRIYDKHNLTITPTAELVEFAKTVLKATEKS